MEDSDAKEIRGACDMKKQFLPLVSVITPVHNPDSERFARVLDALAMQTLDHECWELIIVDNASTKFLNLEPIRKNFPTRLRIVAEPRVGLSAARRRGFMEARADILVLVDDDNVLAEDYLEGVLKIFAAHQKVGAVGGRSLPHFDAQPPVWAEEFYSILALRDLGDTNLVSAGPRSSGESLIVYPPFAPIGAGMALRRAAAQAWLDIDQTDSITDRRGSELTSGGDNDIIFSAMKQGWEVGYFPSLSLTHLIAAGRLERDYLARLNRGIAKSWIQVLAHHGASPWGPIPAWTVPLRIVKAWFAYRGWAGPAEFIRWQGACGHFEGRAAISMQ